MKKVTIKYFATFRDYAGLEEETIEVDVVTALDLFEFTQDRHGLKEPFGQCKVAINDEMAKWSSVLNDGDVVLLFPPVAGG